MTKSAKADDEPRRAKADGEPKKGKKIVGIVALLAVAAAAYFLVLKPKSEGDPEPVAGEVVTLEPIQLNLAAGSYLRIAIALQLTAEAEEADGSRALDATIEMFSGRTVAQLSDLKQRKKLKEDLAVARRIEFIRKGLYGFDKKGGQLLQEGFRRPAPLAPAPAGGGSLDVEVRSDGGAAKVRTNAPAGR